MIEGFYEFVMTNRYIYHRGDDEFYIASLRKYLDQKQEIDKLLDKLITPFIADKKLRILDAGCGLGHSIFFLNQLSPDSIFLGVDQTPIYIKEAKESFGKMPNASFEINNIEDLPQKYPKAFDIAVSRAVISWIPYYDDFIKALIAVTKKHIFLSSLFYEGDIDFITKVRVYKTESGREDFGEYDNVYSLPRFKRFVTGLGAKNIDITDFEIGIDLPKGPIDIMGTYTVKLSNGKRLQISGSIIMTWKWIRIDL